MRGSKGFKADWTVTSSKEKTHDQLNGRSPEKGSGVTNPGRMPAHHRLRDLTSISSDLAVIKLTLSVSCATVSRRVHRRPSCDSAITNTMMIGYIVRTGARRSKNRQHKREGPLPRGGGVE